MNKKLSSKAIALLSLSLSTTLWGQSFISADLASTSDTVATFGTNLDHTTDQSGLPAGALAAATDATILNISHDLGFDAGIQFVDAPEAGVSTGSTSGTFDYTFNSAVDITDVYVWNYSQSGFGNRGLGDYNIFVDTGSGFGSSIATGTLNAANYVNGSHFAQEIDLGGTHSGVVGLRISALNLGGDSIGLDEVAFRAVIPEPSYYTLFAGSLVLAILAIRKRRS
ncbi:hypothetical protein [Rubellicoccus peritrichatus]|uniref:PEP-CTERM protein-sorting domain-containing protein n=1 Tax=Rubellicoccus peritrichatus TaxID=3080537 RepID=A0AAQ3L9J4_9BACT|nr:hypothetical protein [Puniceicoccus sp. CR14]WOO41157.1 hypothetical protein RZN69_21260 [Puniceicoccus sp. CR14]